MNNEVWQRNEYEHKLTLTLNVRKQRKRRKQQKQLRYIIISNWCCILTFTRLMVLPSSSGGNCKTAWRPYIRVSASSRSRLAIIWQPRLMGRWGCPCWSNKPSMARWANSTHKLASEERKVNNSWPAQFNCRRSKICSCSYQEPCLRGLRLCNSCGRCTWWR